MEDPTLPLDHHSCLCLSVYVATISEEQVDLVIAPPNQVRFMEIIINLSFDGLVDFIKETL